MSSVAAMTDERRDRMWALALEAAVVIALVLGLSQTQHGELGFSLTAALSGIGSQIGRTGIAALAILVAAFVNITCAAMLVRIACRVPFASFADVLLYGFAGAVLFDTALLLALGSFGWFTGEVLLVVHVAVLVAAWRWGRPFVIRGPTDREPTWSPLWIIVAILWSAPIVLQLASPVVPFADVLPNHVAPVEHVRTYGSFAELTTMPAPIYGPSRSFLGYTGLLGALSTMTRIEAHLAVAAFAAPLVVVMIVALRRIASVVAGSAVALWVLLTMPLTIVFLRVSDLRSSVVALPLAAIAVSIALRPPPGAVMLLAASLAAALLVHPLIGGLAVLTVFATMAIAGGDHRDLVVRAIPIASVAALPQALTTFGVDAPSWIGLLAIPAAIGTAWLTRRIRLPDVRDLRGAAVVALVIAAIVVLAFALPIARGARDTFGEVMRFPLLAAGAACALVVVPSRRKRRLLAAAFAAAMLTATIVRTLPGDARLWESARSEAVAKIVEFWIPAVLAVAAATALAALWGRSRYQLASRLVVVAFFVCAAYPFGPREDIDNDPLEETRYSESLAIAFHHAEDGFWVRYPDQRELIDHERRELIDAIRREQEAGRLTEDSQVLHLAPSFQQWSATPLAVFTGVIETLVTPDPERSGHTIGGRLHHTDDLSVLLEGPYDFLVMEDDQTADTTGFRPVFTNEYASLYARD